jgi:DNA-binding response OmpR family regulator
MKILLLENTHSLALSINSFLTTLGHSVKYCDGKADFVEMIRSGPYDMFLLDLDASNAISANCIKGIVKIFPHTPIILLSANHNLNVIEKGLELGCTDYLKKPFEFKELELKIRQHNKHIFPLKSSLIHLSESYTYDVEQSRLFYKNEEQSFTKKETALLRLFMLNKKKIISEEQIALAVWNEYFIDSILIRSLLSRLRKKLKEDFIHTYRGQGYVWLDKASC